MKSIFSFVLFGVLLILGALLQQNLAETTVLFSARPDFLLAVIAPLCLFLPPGRSALLGFIAGTLHGTLSGANLTHYIISHSCSCFIISSIKNCNFKIGIFLAGVLSGCTALFAHLLLIFFAPPYSLLPYLQDTIKTMIYNGVLSALVYMLFERCNRPKPGWQS